MIRELDLVVLTRDVPEHGLERGDVGAAVHVYGEGLRFEVEFVAADGRTVALLTLDPEDVRPMDGREILQAREFGGPQA
jgi:hypothetical protein